jgi:rRNA-processing protein FCF1
MTSYSERFWRINELTSVRMAEMIRQECQVQLDWLSTTAATLEGLVRRFSQPEEVHAVLDTNVVLHYRPVRDVDWPSVLGSSKTVRLVIPLRVIDELDVKKAARSPALARRAASRLRDLERSLTGSTGANLATGLKLEIVALTDFDPELRRRALSPVDVEILDICAAIAGCSGPNPTHLVTGDLGMRIRAAQRGISLKPMPDADRQPLGGIQVDEANEG